jgi:glutathione S-transferase
MDLAPAESDVQKWRGLMLELYHAGISVCSEKVRILLAERDTPFFGRMLDLRAGDQQKPEYLKLNPNAVVPTIVHDGNVVIESNIILEYLAEVLPGPSLVTSGPLGRVRMRYWTKQLDESIHQLTSVISFAIGFRYQLLAKPPEEALAVLRKIPDPFRRERQLDIYEKGIESHYFAPAIRRFDKMLADMEKELISSTWLAGADYSLADIAFTPYVNRLEQLQLSHMWEKRSHVSKWFEAVRRRPSFAKAYDGFMATPVIDVMREKGQATKHQVKAIIRG